MITNLKHLQLALRLSEIPRWGIVAMGRQQSTAEHSFRVAMIAGAIYHHMEGGTPHNSLEERDLIGLCMVHDMFEVLSGDLDSIFKGMLEREFPGAYDQTVANMAHQRGLGGLHSQVEGMERAAKGSIVGPIKKVADLVEAILYIDTYGANQFERERVLIDLKTRVREKITDYMADHQYKSYNWSRCWDFVRTLISYPPVDITGGAAATPDGSTVAGRNDA